MVNEYGYPICCNSWFLARMCRKITFELTYLQKKYYNYGFIPCPECAKKLECENMRLDQLILQQYRTVNNPFPMCYPRSDDEIKKIILN